MVAAEHRGTSRVRFEIALATFGFAFVVSPSSFAHDYWLEADRYVLPKGGCVSVHLLMGEDFVRDEERGFERAKFSRFDRIGPFETRSLLAEASEGQMPIAHVSFPHEGPALLVADRTLQRITLEAAKFNAYLHEEGLDAILADRGARGELARPGRERYTRSLKALLRSGTSTPDLHRRVLGQRIEIRLDTDPAAVRPDSPLAVSILFEGKPLANVAVEAHVRAAGGVKAQRAKSSSQGGVLFVAARGTWLVRLVHMRRCEGCVDADWESFWASYTFEV